MIKIKTAIIALTLVTTANAYMYETTLMERYKKHYDAFSIHKAKSSNEKPILLEELEEWAKKESIVLWKSFEAQETQEGTKKLKVIRNNAAKLKWALWEEPNDYKRQAKRRCIDSVEEFLVKHKTKNKYEIRQRFMESYVYLSKWDKEASRLAMIGGDYPEHAEWSRKHKACNIKAYEGLTNTILY